MNQLGIGELGVTICAVVLTISYLFISWSSCLSLLFITIGAHSASSETWCFWLLSLLDIQSFYTCLWDLSLDGDINLKDTHVYTWSLYMLRHTVWIVLSNSISLRITSILHPTRITSTDFLSIVMSGVWSWVFCILINCLAVYSLAG